jgi:hypothetical protein
MAFFLPEARELIGCSYGMCSGKAGTRIFINNGNMQAL